MRQSHSRDQFVAGGCLWCKQKAHIVRVMESSTRESFSQVLSQGNEDRMGLALVTQTSGRSPSLL